MLRSSAHPQYTQHPTSSRNISEAPITRQSKDKMSYHPYSREGGIVGSTNGSSRSSSVVSTTRISGTTDNYKYERVYVLQNIADYSRTSWKQLQCLLNSALKRNDGEVVRKIIDTKLPLSLFDDDPNDRTLWLALQMGDVATATRLVGAGTDVNRRHPVSGATYLHWLASKHGDEYHSLAIMMMNYGADVDATDKTENSVLHVAAEFGLPRFVEELILRRQANIDVANKAGQSIVYAAAKNAQAVEMLSLLIGYSNDLVTRNKRCIDAFYALSDLNVGNRQIRMLLDLGFPLDQYGRKGSTLLYEAVLEKKIDLVKMLLEYGADVNKKLRNGKLPLHAAARQKDPTIFKLLIEKGASVHHCSDDYNGQYPIHNACKHEALANIKLLLRLGADVNVIDKSGRTPFALVSTENFTDLQSYVIKHIAIAMARRSTVNRSDLVKIRASLDMQDYFEKCMIELQTMKETCLYENISCFGFFERNLIDLRVLVKLDFVKTLDVFRRKCKETFPIYHKEIAHLSRQLERMKFALDEKVQIVREISGHDLPEHVVDLIAFYACLDDVRRMQQEYYFASVNE